MYYADTSRWKLIVNQNKFVGNFVSSSKDMIWSSIVIPLRAGKISTWPRTVPEILQIRHWITRVNVVSSIYLIISLCIEFRRGPYRGTSWQIWCIHLIGPPFSLPLPLKPKVKVHLYLLTHSKSSTWFLKVFSNIPRILLL